MTTRSEVPGDGLFYESLIQSYVKAQHFVERPWLTEQIQQALDDPACRFLLLTAEPGAGKSAFVAWLASQHPNWPRYFIRRDQRTPLGDVGAHSLLLQIGFQLAATMPTLFKHEQVKVAIEQRIARLDVSGQVVAAEVGKIFASPFYQMVVQIQQQIEQNNGSVVGIRIDEWVTDPRLLALSDLQYLALLDPALVLLKEDPHTKIVVLIDALDELRYSPSQESVLTWLANCPALPSNVRIILTSRPEENLNSLRQRQAPWLRELEIDPQSPQVQSDLRQYATSIVAEESIQIALVDQDTMPDQFVTQIVAKAAGNFQYLNALAKGIQQALALNEQETLNRLLQAKDIPTGLGQLYAFFLTQIKDQVADKSVEVPGKTFFEKYRVSMWSELYQPILGVLAVAREPLDIQQIKGFGAIQTEDRWVHEALAHLRQFLDQVAHRYRLYHSTFPEFITSPATQISDPTCYLDPVEWQGKIISYYRSKGSSWEEVPWRNIDDYGLLHLAQHLYVLRDIEAARKELYSLICKPFMHEKYVRHGSHRPFADCVALATEVACGEIPPNLGQEVRNRLIYATLSSFSTNIPPEALETLAQLGLAEKALDLAMLMTANDRMHQVEAYLLISKTLWERQKTAHAKAVLKRAIEAARQEQFDVIRAMSLANIAQTLGRFGMKDELYEVLAQIEGTEDTSFKAKARLEAAEALIKVGEKEKAVVVAVRAMWLPEEDAWSTTEVNLGIAQTFALAGERESALGMVAQALSNAGNLENRLTIAMAWRKALRVIVSLGETNNALSIAEDMKDAWLKAECLLEIAEILLDAGDTQQGIEVLKHSLAVAMHVLNEPYIIEELCTMVQLLHKTEGKVYALSVLEQVYALTEVLEPPEYRLIAQMKVAQTFARLGQVETAKALAVQALTSISNDIDYFRGEFDLKELTLSLSETGLFELALKLANAVGDKDARSRVLRGIVGDIAKAGQSDMAVEVANTIEDGETRSAALSSVARALVQLDMVERAVAVANLAITTMQEVISDPAEAPTLGMIAQALLGCGEEANAAEVANEALKMAEAVRDPFTRARAFIELAPVLVPFQGNANFTGIEDKAVAAVEVIELNQHSALTEVALGMVHLGKLERAVEIANNALSTAQTIENAWYKAAALGEVARVFSLAKDETGLKRTIAVSETITQAKPQKYALYWIEQAWAHPEIELETLYAATHEMISEVLRGPGQEDDEADLPIEPTRLREKVEVSSSNWREALAKAQFTSRYDVFQALKAGVPSIASIDRGQTLWSVYKNIMEVESWWEIH